MWNKVKAFADSAFMLNAAIYAVPALTVFAFTNVFFGLAVFAVLPLVYLGREYLKRTKLTVAHVASVSDVDSIIENGFNAGTAEANLTEDEKLRYTQRGNVENICFAVDKLEPVIAMRKAIEPGVELKTIYFNVENIDNIRVSTMYTSSWFTSTNHGVISEAGIDRSIINEMIKNGEYSFESETFGRGFAATVAKVTNVFWCDANFSAIAAEIRS